MSIVLDAGALIAVGRGKADVVSLVLREHKQNQDLVTSAAVVAQVWRGDPRQALLARFLSGVLIHPLTPEAGRQVGVLLGQSRTSDVVDAHIALVAQDGDAILTSDPGDLSHLLEIRGIDVAIRKI